MYVIVIFRQLLSRRILGTLAASANALIAASAQHPIGRHEYRGPRGRLRALAHKEGGIGEVAQEGVVAALRGARRQVRKALHELPGLHVLRADACTAGRAVSRHSRRLAAAARHLLVGKASATRKCQGRLTGSPGTQPQTAPPADSAASDSAATQRQRCHAIQAKQVGSSTTPLCAWVTTSLCKLYFHAPFRGDGAARAAASYRRPSMRKLVGKKTSAAPRCSR